VIGILLFSFSTLVVAEQQVLELDDMEVVGVSPIGGDISLHKVPTNVQTISAEELQQGQSISLADYMNRYMGSVYINEAQNNPLQPDISYRGFTASPLLGLPQGLSVYVNGVRFNEPFGDTVNWDLIAPGAIESTVLQPGSNPVYGLNTLGGAIAIKTKTGFSAPGHQFEAYGGSFERHSEELSSGWNNGEFGYYMNLHNFGEKGWRDHSRSSARQGLLSLNWRHDRGGLDLTLAANDSDLKGNGAVPIQLLQQDREAIFTHPDQTKTRMFFAELSGDFDVTDEITVSGNAYFRRNRITSFNGDDSDFEACEDPTNAGFLCGESANNEEIIIDVNGRQVLASDAVEGATNNTSFTNQKSQGFNLQSLFAQEIFGRENQLVVGGGYETADVRFESDTELGRLTADRGTKGSGVLNEEARVRLDTTTASWSLFFSDSFSITKALTITVAGRYNHSEIELKNRFIGAEGDKLSGTHVFERFNPSAGLTYQFNDAFGFYGNYSESSRVPTPMELSCADENDPCRLPNAFVSDPPLEMVVAKSWEAGFRGNLDEYMEYGDLQWNAGFFHTVNHDDIIFHRGGDSISEGFFSNIGKTRRYGVEAGLSTTWRTLLSDIDDWHFSANYTYINARFLDSFKTQNPLDPEDEAGVVVRKGSQIPGIPEHLFKASLGVDLWQSWFLGFDTYFNGEQFFRGDEANQTRPLPGYWVFNFRTEFKVNEHFTLFGRVDNLADKRYSSFGVYGEASEVLGDGFNDNRFVSPGAPRAGWVGVRFTL
jgi:outer membrane receptor protein involved in Fe transport